jgi:cell wall assembly regulator SMI1
MFTQQLIDYWSKLGLRVGTANSPNDIRRFETQWQVTLPLDMREYFLSIGGMAEYEIDPETLFSFWPLHQLSPVTVELPDKSRQTSKGYFAFADHSILAIVYGINLMSESPVYGSVATDIEHRMIQTAPSFTEFIRIYLTDPFRLVR